MSDLDWNDPEVRENIETLAAEYYDTYGKDADYTNWQGLKMPTWEVLPKGQKNSWYAVAKRSVQIFVDAYENM